MAAPVSISQSFLQEKGDSVASLTVMSAENDDQRIGRIIPIYAKQDLFIGRDQNACGLSFESAFISRLHFRIYSIEFEGSEEETGADNPHDFPALLYCEDRMSVNGTYINNTLIGKKMSPRIPYLLNHGDIITILPHWKFIFKQNLSYKNTFTDIQVEEMMIFEDVYKVSNRLLGKGNWGTVYAAIEVPTKKQLACKIIDFRRHGAIIDTDESDRNQRVARQLREKRFREVEILKDICHPNIVTFHKAYYSNESLYIFSELAPGGDLFAFVESSGGCLDDFSACVVCHQVAIAVDFLHSRGIAHRDLKLENILVMRNSHGSRVVLTDFGEATYFKNNVRMTSLVGTADYLAPEIRKMPKGGGYTEATDLWAMGVLATCMLTGVVIFSCNESAPMDQNEVDTRISMLDQPQYVQDAWAAASLDAKNFVRRLYIVDPARRMTAHEAVRHDWFRKPNGREADLNNLYQRTNACWEEPPITTNMIEPIPSATQVAPKPFKKLPDTTASTYFNLERHLRPKLSSRSDLRRNRKRILEDVMESSSGFVNNSSCRPIGVYHIPAFKRHKNVSPQCNYSSTSVKFQSLMVAGDVENLHVMTPRTSQCKPSGLEPLRPGKKRSILFPRLHSLENSKTIQVDANDMFAAEPVEIMAAKAAEAARKRFDQLNNRVFDASDEKDIGMTEPNQEHMSNMFMMHKLTDPESPLTGYLLSRTNRKSHVQLGVDTTKMRIDELSLDENLRHASSKQDVEGKKGDTDREFSSPNMTMEEATNPDKDITYTPSKDVTTMNQDVIKPQLRTQHPLARGYTIQQEVYDDAWRSLPKFTTAKALREAVAARRERRSQ